MFKKKKKGENHCRTVFLTTRVLQMSRGERHGDHRRRVLALQRQPRTVVRRHRVHRRGQGVQQKPDGKAERAHPARDDGQRAARSGHVGQQVRYFTTYALQHRLGGARLRVCFGHLGGGGARVRIDVHRLALDFL